MVRTRPGEEREEKRVKFRQGRGRRKGGRRARGLKREEGEGGLEKEEECFSFGPLT